MSISESIKMAALTLVLDWHLHWQQLSFQVLGVGPKRTTCAQLSFHSKLFGGSLDLQTYISSSVTP